MRCISTVTESQSYTNITYASIYSAAYNITIIYVSTWPKLPEIFRISLTLSIVELCQYSLGANSCMPLHMTSVQGVFTPFRVKRGNTE